MIEVRRGRVRAAGWTAVTPGAWVATDEPSLTDRLRAWRLVLPESAVFTHLTAAAVRGWWMPAPVPRPVFAAVSKHDQHPQRRGLQVTRLQAVPSGEWLAGVLVATAAETLLACARDLALLDLVPLADSALRLRHTDLDELHQLAAERRRGAPALREALPLLDARSESPWESVMRVLHHAAGVRVEPQHVVVGSDGHFVARADLWLVGTRRLHEYDGEVHRDLDVHRADLDRDRRLIEEGWQRCGWTATEVLRRGGSIITSADRALGREWEPVRLQRWRELVSRSLYGSAGRTRAARRWATEC